MGVTSILAFVEPDGVVRDAPALVSALNLGGALSALVEAMCYTVDVISPGAPEPDLSAARAAILSRAAEAGVPCEVIDRPSFADGIGEVLASRLKVADLGILEGSPRPYTGQRLLLEAGLFDSGHPVIVLAGAAMAVPRRVMVGWDGSAAAVRAMTAALPILKLADETVVVRVAEGKPDGTGQPQDGIIRHLARHGIRASFREVPPGRGEPHAALATAAAADGCDLLVCGAVRRSRAQEMLFGGVTGAVLAGAAGLPVLLMA